MSERVASGHLVLTPTVHLWWEWHGGAYIELGRIGRGAAEVINVWDDEKDEPRIDRTKKAAEEKVREWVKEYPVDSLIHDVTENWY